MAPQSRAGLDQDDRRDCRRSRTDGSTRPVCPSEIRRLGLATVAGLGDPPADHLGLGCLGDVVDLDALASGSTARGAAEGRVVRREDPVAGLEGSERYEESIYTISLNYLLLVLSAIHRHTFEAFTPLLPFLFGPFRFAGNVFCSSTY